MTLPMRWARKERGARTSGMTAMTTLVLAGLSFAASLKKIGKNLRHAKAHRMSADIVSYSTYQIAGSAEHATSCHICVLKPLDLVAGISGSPVLLDRHAGGEPKDGVGAQKDCRQQEVDGAPARPAALARRRRRLTLHICCI